MSAMHQLIYATLSHLFRMIKLCQKFSPIREIMVLYFLLVTIEQRDVTLWTKNEQ